MFRTNRLRSIAGLLFGLGLLAFTLVAAAASQGTQPPGTIIQPGDEPDPHVIEFSDISEVADQLTFVAWPTAGVEGLKTGGGVLEIVPIGDLNRDLLRVTLMFEDDLGQTYTLVASNVPWTPPTERAEAVEAVNVGGESGTALKLRNVAGTPIGYVYWSTNEATYRIAASNIAEQELAKVATAINQGLQ